VLLSNTSYINFCQTQRYKITQGKNKYSPQKLQNLAEIMHAITRNSFIPKSTKTTKSTKTVIKNIPTPIFQKVGNGLAYLAGNNNSCSHLLSSMPFKDLKGAAPQLSTAQPLKEN
jgi:hypothetical protein